MWGSRAYVRGPVNRGASKASQGSYIAPSFVLRTAGAR